MFALATLFVVFFALVAPLAIAAAIFYFAYPHLLKFKANQRAQMEVLTHQARADLLRRHEATPYADQKASPVQVGQFHL